MQVVGDPRQAFGRNIDRNQLRKFRLQLQQMAGLAAGRRARIENALARLGRDQARAELRGGILNRHVAVGEPGVSRADHALDTHAQAMLLEMADEDAVMARVRDGDAVAVHGDLAGK